jgi:sirohydrochlorin cobaltochelatase
LRVAVARLAAQGASKITVLTTMFTPGGSHSEFELPAEVTQISDQYPGVTIEYAWPYPLDLIADFLLSHIDRRPIVAQGR